MAIAVWIDAGWRLAVATGVTLAFGYGLANLLEFLQVFTPDRVVSNSDVIAQTIGAARQGRWLAVRRPADDRLAARRRPRRDNRPRRLWRRVQALLVIRGGWLILMALPLELTLSPGALVHKFRTGGIVLLPFAGTTTRSPTASGM